MAGFNTKNLLENKPSITMSPSDASETFKIHEGDVRHLVLQINSSADPGTITLDTSYDGGQSWRSITMTNIAAYSGGLVRVRLPDTFIGSNNLPDMLGPLARVRSANSVTVTAIWKTVVS